MFPSLFKKGKIVITQSRKHSLGQQIGKIRIDQQGTEGNESSDRESGDSRFHTR